MQGLGVLGFRSAGCRGLGFRSVGCRGLGFRLPKLSVPEAGKTYFFRVAYYGFILCSSRKMVGLFVYSLFGYIE